MSEPHIVSAIKPIIYAGSPLRPAPEEDYDAGLIQNLNFAEQVCHEIALAGGVPYAPHLIFPRFLDDAIAAERDLAIDMGLRMISIVDEAWFIVPPWRKELSSGMRAERAYAERLGIPTRVCYDVAAFAIQKQRLTAREVVIRMVPGPLRDAFAPVV